jgi:hypothetical protein
MARKKSPSQLDREIAAALTGKAELRKLVDKWKAAVAFNSGLAETAHEERDYGEAGYRNGYASAMETAASDLLALIQRKA